MTKLAPYSFEDTADGRSLVLAPLPCLRAIAAEWGLIGPTLNELGNLREVVTWQLGDTDLRVFRDHVELRRVVVKDARALEALGGVGDLPELEVLGIIGAPRLHHISDVGPGSPRL